MPRVPRYLTGARTETDGQDSQLSKLTSTARYLEED
jgi:hypothetical protein